MKISCATMAMVPVLALVALSPGRASATFSGVDAVSASTLESFLGLAPLALDGLDSNGSAAVEGSAILQSVSVSAGDTLHFSYDFASEEGQDASAGENDVAFVVIQSLSLLADTFDPLEVSALPLDFFEGVGETGYQTFLHTFTAGGDFAIGIGVLDVGDDIVVSALLLDDLQLTSSTGAITNAGFESGLAGWSTAGDVSVQTATIGVAPIEGSFHVFLTTMSAADVPEPGAGPLLGCGLVALARGATRRPGGH